MAKVSLIYCYVAAERTAWFGELGVPPTNTRKVAIGPLTDSMPRLERAERHNNKKEE